MNHSLRTTSQTVKQIVESPAKLIIVAGCNRNCIAQLFEMVDQALPPEDHRFMMSRRIERADGRKIMFFLDKDLDLKTRGLGGFELYRD
jgi:hypothetical protein